jgi:hypothetical protein
VPDEAAAWERITADIRDERRTTGRRRLYVVVGGLAAAGAAAAFVVLAGDDEPREAVDVRPPATEPVVPTTTVTPTTLAGLAPLSDLDSYSTALAVVNATETGEYSGITVYDDDGSGTVTPVGPTAFSYAEPSVTRDGTLWFTEETGDTSAVTRVPFGTTEKEQPFGDETRSPAVSPDGSTIAFVHDGVTVERPSIRFVDLATGEQTRELFWADDEDDFFLTQGSMRGLEWSPDGTRLLFVNDYEGSEVRVVDPAAATLSASTRLVDADASVAHWLGPLYVVVIDRCCYPDHENHEVRTYNLTTGDYEAYPNDSRTVRDVDGTPDSQLVLLFEDGMVRLGGAFWNVGDAHELGW